MQANDTNGRWMDGQTDGQTDGRMDGQKDEWIDRWMDGRTEILPCDLQDIVPFGSTALLHIHIINKILAGQGYR